MTTENKVRIAAVIALTVLLSAGAGFGGGVAGSYFHPGPPGPPGLQGVQGSTGPQGTAGLQGPQGRAGDLDYTCYAFPGDRDVAGNPVCLLGRRLR